MYVFYEKSWKKINKYLTNWQKVRNIIKKINSELIYNKKYLKAEKESF